MSIKITDLVISEETIAGKKLLTDVKPCYEYDKSGKRTETVVAFKYEVVLPEKNFERINVKVPGANPLVNKRDEFFEVEFDELEIKIYYIDKAYRVCYSAKNIRPVKHQ